MTDQPVALTIASPPLVGKGPRLNNASIGETPDSPRVLFRNVDACISPHFQFAEFLPNISSSSATPCSKDFRIISPRVSLTSVVVLSSHHVLLSSSGRMISFQREPRSGK